MGSYLYHDHPKRIDIRSSADWLLPVQNLWCGPSHSVIVSHGFRGPKFWADGGKTKVCEACVIHIIHEYAGLGNRSVCFGRCLGTSYEPPSDLHE